MRKWDIARIIIVCVTGLWVIYIFVISDGISKELLRALAMCVFFASETLADVISRKEVWSPPVEVKENEEYILAEARIRDGERVSAVGAVMLVVPLIILFVKKELHGILAELSIFSCLGGVVLLIIGATLCGRGAAYINEKAQMYLEELEVEPKPMSKVAIICKVIGWIAFALWGVTLLMK